MSDTLTVTLSRPIDGVSSITLRQPTVQEVHDAEVAWGKAGAGVDAFRTFQMKLAALLSGVSMETLDKLPIRKSAEVTAFVQANVDGAPPLPSPLPETHEVMLSETVTDGEGVPHDRLCLQEPTLGQIRVAERAMNGGTDQAATRRYMMQIVHQVSELGWLQVTKLPNVKVNEAAAYCLAFLAAGPETGTA